MTLQNKQAAAAAAGETNKSFLDILKSKLPGIAGGALAGGFGGPQMAGQLGMLGLMKQLGGNAFGGGVAGAQTDPAQTTPELGNNQTLLEFIKQGLMQGRPLNQLVEEFNQAKTTTESTGTANESPIPSPF